MSIPAHTLKEILENLPNAANYHSDRLCAVWQPEIKITRSYIPDARVEINELIFIKKWGSVGWYWELQL